MGTSDLPRRAPVGPKYLGYTKTEQVSAGNTAIWENMDAVFKGANFRNPFQPTKDSARDGTCGLDIGPDGEL
ncbi:toxin C-terminal domain-containing protein [Amycolatopsis nivea]|uniref:toxin C-terminal domain-containing protein n=1 Tax=Amycolatopsis sp. CFH S0740 TaxID=1644111 RepID=UPI0034DE6386